MCVTFLIYCEHSTSESVFFLLLMVAVALQCHLLYPTGAEVTAAS
jgi:hypothetical protein